MRLRQVVAPVEADGSQSVPPSALYVAARIGATQVLGCAAVEAACPDLARGIGQVHEEVGVAPGADV